MHVKYNRAFPFVLLRLYYVFLKLTRFLSGCTCIPVFLRDHIIV